MSKKIRIKAEKMKKKQEPIAIVGVGCRFPGKTNSADAMWKMLMEGTDAVIEIPKDRWNIDKFYQAEMGAPGKTYAKWGGFIEGIDQFDPECFGISPREADLMDPQQRLLLEVAWEALEDSGKQVDKLAGSNTGVYIGLCTNDYAQIQAELTDAKHIDPHSATGSAFSIAANRVSYCLDFHGPSMVVDTACSSSLVATHLACTSLLNNECDLALAGGVNLILLPSPFISFCAATMLSPDGRCKAFDERANGFVRGEGAGMVVLKRLSTALADKDEIYAVINATGVNSDGRTNGISLPGKEAQANLIESVYQQAGIERNKVFYIEAHGTGTAVGDPIEASTLGEKFGANREVGDTCIIGSVKTNIGHLEAGAGIAGLIKATLCLKHRTIPPNLHFQNPNPNIPFDELKLEVPVSPVIYPEDRQRDMIVGVNSFGFGGTNAHAVLTEYHSEREQLPEDNKKSVDATYLLPLSARSEEGLKALAHSYIDFLDQTENIKMADLVHTASMRRSLYSQRLSLVADTLSAMKQQLQYFIDGEMQAGMFQRQCLRETEFKLAFVFSGQGPQWWAMGRQLLETEPAFREKIKECDTLMSFYADWSLYAELTADENNSRIAETEISQPLLFALQVALVELWKSRGIVAEAVVGHSVGEVAAAYIAGALDLKTAIKVIYYRGWCMSHATGEGGMLAAALTSEQAEERIATYAGKICIAAINSPTSVSLSGSPELLKDLAAKLEQDTIFHRMLDVQFAFHSEQMDPVRDELVNALAGIKLGNIQIPIYSTVSGQQAEHNVFDNHYWWHNVRDKVCFASAVQSMVADGCNTFIEIGPHPVLTGSIIESAQKKVTVIPSLHRKQEDTTTMLGAVGNLFTLGCPINWEKIHKQQGHFIHLPGYPWQRQSYWHESENWRELRAGQVTHPLLTTRTQTADPSWNSTIDILYYPYLADHKVRDSIVFPAAAYVEMTLAAAHEVLHGEAFVLEDIQIQKALYITENSAPILQFTMNSGNGAFLIRSSSSSLADATWTTHCKGYIRKISKPATVIDMDYLRQSCPKFLTGKDIYSRFSEMGLPFGPAFRGMSGVYAGDGVALGEVRLLEINQPYSENYHFHPAILDACLQTMVGCIPRDFSNIYLPVAIDHLYFYHNAFETMMVCAELIHINKNSLAGNLRIYSKSGQLLMEILGFRCQSLDLRTKQVDPYYQYHWQQSPISDMPRSYKEVDFLPDLNDLAEQMNLQARAYQEWYGGAERLHSMVAQFEKLGVAYIVNALFDLGCTLQQGSSLSIESLVAERGVKGQYQQLLQRFFKILEEQGYLQLSTSECGHIKQTWVRPDLTALGMEALNANPAALAELTLIRNCGSQLAAILIGEQDPLQLIFPDGSSTLAEHFYADSPSSLQYIGMIQKAIKMVVDNLPRGRSLRILEIGAGTGGLTSGLLGLLPKDRVEYYFTDISGSFFVASEQRFNEFPFVRYQMLDIEKDIQDQGFDLNSFDVILGSNVLHATKSLQVTLQNIHHLLAPSGLLLILEVEQRMSWIDIVFGLTDGWWRFEDYDIRSDYPLISREKWEQVLLSNGFSSPYFTPTSTDKKEFEQLVFMAVAENDLTPNDNEQSVPKYPTTSSEKHWLIFADLSGVADVLKNQLETAGNHVTLVHVGDDFASINKDIYQIKPGNKAHIVRLLSEIFGNSSFGVVHLWNVDLIDCEEAGNEALIQSELVGCQTLLYLLQALNESELNEQLEQLVIVTQGAQTLEVEAEKVHIEQSTLIGFVRVIQDEQPKINCKAVDLDPALEALDAVQFLYTELITEDKENEVLFRYGERFAPRLREVVQAELIVDNSCGDNAFSFRLDVEPAGAINNLRLSQQKIEPLQAGQVRIQVQAAALNFRDVMKALGLYPTDDGGDTLLGDECSGVVTAAAEGVDDFKVGDEVIAIAQGCFASEITIDQQLVMHKPVHLNFQEAATIPVVFLTVYYALHHLAHIKKGDKILIQAAAGGVGLAAVQLAKHAGAEVFVTVGNNEKRSLLKSLGADHIMNSRSLTFADDIMAITAGRGVDIVLNSLAGDAIAKGIDSLAPYGRFLELGKIDIYQNNNIGLWAFRKNLAFFAIDLSAMLVDKPELYVSMLKDIYQLVADRVLAPLPHRVFPITRIKEAFRYMAQGKHIGKVVISLREPNIPILPLVKEQRLQFDKQSSYLITGGLGGFGVTLAHWLIEHGVENLILVSRSGASSESAQQTLAELKSSGANVVALKADVSDEEQVAALADLCADEMPPLKGIFHTAMVISDGLIMQMNDEQFNSVLAPKVQGAWNLHHYFAEQELDYFVLFSSFSSIVGNSGQANYVAANFFLDMFAHYRRAQGLPAIAINWGALSEVGYIANQAHQGVADILENKGIIGISPKEAMQIMHHILLENPIQIAPARIRWLDWGKKYRDGSVPLRFSSVIDEKELKESRGDQSGQIRMQIEQAEADECLEIVTQYIREQVAAVLRVPAEKLELEQPLNELGLDSLMMVELGIRIENSLSISLPTGQLMQTPSLAGLSKVVLKVLGKDTGDAPSAAVSSSKLLQAEDLPQYPDCLVSLKPGTGEKSLFCFHPSGGLTVDYKIFADLLPDEISAVGLQSCTLAGAEQEFKTIQLMAEEYVKSIRQQADGPYYLLGFSVGGIICHVAAKILLDLGEQVAFVGMVDSPINIRNETDKKELFEQFIPEIVNFFFTELSVFQGLSKADRERCHSDLLQLISESDNTEIEDIVIDWLKHQQFKIDPIQLQIIHRYFALFRKHSEMVAENILQPLKKISVYVWGASESYHCTDTDPQARDQLSSIAVHYEVIEGTHYSILKQPSVDQLVSKVSQVMLGEPIIV